jgi:hypothetical protein
MKKINIINFPVILLCFSFSYASYEVKIPLKDSLGDNFLSKKIDNNNNTIPESNDEDWTILSTNYSEWINVGDVYDMDEDFPDVREECTWYGNPAMTEKGVEFEMFRYCYQDQERTATVEEQNTVTNETRNRVLAEKEKQTIDTEETKSAVGTRVDFEEFNFVPNKATNDNLVIVGSYRMDGYYTGTPFVTKNNINIYLHFIHNTTDNTYKIGMFLKDDGNAPSDTDYTGSFIYASQYANDIARINYVDAQGKVANVYYGTSRTQGYRGNYALFNANIPKADFDMFYNNPSMISTIRIHLKSMNAY